MPPVQIVEYVYDKKKGLALIATQPIPRGSIVFTERAMECVQLPRTSKHNIQNHYVKACQQCFRSMELIDCFYYNTASISTNTTPVTMLPLAHLWPVPDYPWYRLDGKKHEENDKNKEFSKNQVSQLGIQGNAAEGCYIQCCDCFSSFCSMKCYEEYLNTVGSCCSCQRVIKSLYNRHNGSEVVPQMPLLLGTKMFCSAIHRHRRRRQLEQQNGNQNIDYYNTIDDILNQMCGNATDVAMLEIGDDEDSGQNTARPHYSLKRNYDQISTLLQLTEEEQQTYNLSYFERLVSIAARNGFEIKTESPFEAYYRAILRQSIVAGGRNTEEHRNVVSRILTCLAGEGSNIDRRTIDADLSEVCCVSALAIFPLLSKINHSCLPNVEVQHGLFKECIVDLVAKRNIEKGEELTVSYINLGLDGTEIRTTAYRRKLLHSRYLFWCDCLLCSSASSWSSPP